MKYKSVLLGVILFSQPGLCQEVYQYGLQPLYRLEEYKELAEKSPSLALVSLDTYIPGIKLDIRYAGSNNLMGKPLYKTAKAFLSRPAAAALKSVQQELKGYGYGLKIYDAYRPYGVTLAFYEKFRDTVFVASPYRGSRHNRGCAVDLTLINLSTGKELEMPTPFDEFSPKAHSAYADLPSAVIKNRELLKALMLKYGFEIYPDEWWHYDFKGWEEHPVMDIPFEALMATSAF